MQKHITAVMQINAVLHGQHRIEYRFTPVKAANPERNGFSVSKRVDGDRWRARLRGKYIIGSLDYIKDKMLHNVQANDHIINAEWLS